MAGLAFTLLTILAGGCLIVIMIVLGLQNALYLIQLLASMWIRLREPLGVGTTRELWALQAEQSLPVSILAPAYNEELTIAESIRALLSLNYPKFEVIVINDGSPDATLDRLKQAFGLEPCDREPSAHLDHAPIRAIYRSPRHPRLVVIDKANGRKADALNAGLNHARYPLVCAIDADSLIEADGLLRVTQPFLHDDGSLVAVGGVIRLANGSRVAGGKVIDARLPEEWLARFQALEYLRAFMVARVAAAHWSMLMLISGAFGVFRRSAVIAAGGYFHQTVGEDLELVVRLQRLRLSRGRKPKVCYVPDALCWTEAPVTLAGLRNQRTRWAQGALETVTRHSRMLFNPRYGRAGMIGMPLILLEDLLVPLAEVAGYLLIPVFLLTDRTSLLWLLGTLLFSLLFGTALSLGALLLEDRQFRGTARLREFSLLLLTAVIENLGYRQANSWFRLRGLRSFLRKERRWAAVPRQGFSVPK